MFWSLWSDMTFKKPQHVLQSFSVAGNHAWNAGLMFSWDVFHPIRMIIQSANKGDWLKGAAGSKRESEIFSLYHTLTHPGATIIWLTVWLREEACCRAVLLSRRTEKTNLAFDLQQSFVKKQLHHYTAGFWQPRLNLGGVLSMQMRIFLPDYTCLVCGWMFNPQWL